MLMAEASAINILELRISPEENKAMEKARMPNPPIHCVRLRHSRMPWGMLSRSCITVTPKVVKPLMVSNHAFTGLSTNL